MEQLQAANAALKARGVKGRIIVVRDSLFLRGTFTAADGTRKDRKICLDLPAHQGQLLTAENRVLQLAEIINDTGMVPALLPWDAPVVEVVEKADSFTVAEAVARLEEDFWQGKIRTSAAKRTWDRLVAETNRMPEAATLTMDLMVATVDATEPGSRSRQESCKVLKRLAKLVEIEGTDRLDALRTSYEPGVREIPDGEELAHLLSGIVPGDKWWWPTWALITYGCRPAETFSLRPNGDGTARVLSVKRKTKLPEWRTALALPVSITKEELVDDMRGESSIPYDMPGERTVPWDVTSPAEYDSIRAKQHCDAWQKWLRRQHPTLSLYDIRHAWAVRSITKVPSTSLAAKCMGHTVSVHHNTYHRWLDQADIAAVAAALAG